MSLGLPLDDETSAVSLCSIDSYGVYTRHVFHVNLRGALELNELNLARYQRLPETRELGKSFYPTLLEWARSVPEDEPLILSFEDVEFVSPSFIDETIARLVKEYPDIADRLHLASIDSFSLRTIRSTLRARGIDRVIPVYEPA